MTNEQLAQKYLTDEDTESLRRFCECCEDSESGGHDVPKSTMKRLEQIGVVRNIGFGRHEITSFGSYLVEPGAMTLPLKTIDEHNKEREEKWRASLNN